MGKKKSQKEKGFIAASLENFWYYYKWPFIGGIVLFFAVLVFMSSVTDTSVPTDADVVSVFARPLTMQEYEFQSRLQDQVSDVDNDGNVVIGTEGLYISEAGTSDNDVLNKNKFEVKMSYAQGDLVLMDGTNMERFVSKDLWAPLTDYVDISDFSEEDIYYRNGVPIAVRLSDSKILTDMQFIIDDVYAGIMFVPDELKDTAPARRENAAKMLLKLTEK